MKKILYANGDSFTFGMEILGGNDRRQQNKDLAYPALLAEKLNIPQVVNGSFLGAPNEFIFRQTMFELLELENKGIKPEEMLVVVGWTVPFRSEINLKAAVEDARAAKVMCDDPTARTNLVEYPEFNAWGNIFISAFAGTKYQVDRNTAIDIEDAKAFHVDFIWDWDLEYNRWFSYIIALEHFLKARGYDFVFFNAIHPFNLDIDKINNQAKRYRNLLQGDNYYNFLDWGWSDWGQKKFPETVTQYQHFNGEMHERFSGMLLTHINQHILKNNE